MGFITPAVAAVVATVGTAATTGVTLAQAAKAKKDAARRRAEEIAMAGEAKRKDELLVSRENRMRQRRAAGSRQETILGGASSQGEIGRNVLLGQ